MKSVWIRQIRDQKCMAESKINGFGFNLKKINPKKLSDMENNLQFMLPNFLSFLLFFFPRSKHDNLTRFVWDAFIDMGWHFQHILRYCRGSAMKLAWHFKFRKKIRKLIWHQHCVVVIKKRIVWFLTKIRNNDWVTLRSA